MTREQRDHQERTGHERHGRCRVCRRQVHEYPFGVDHTGFGDGDVRVEPHEPDPEWTCCR